MLVRLQNATFSFYATERDWQDRFGKRARSRNGDLHCPHIFCHAIGTCLNSYSE
jgi:hypothetical protein